MKVLVTGATGFIGRHVVTSLLQQGHSVVATSSDKTKAISCSWIQEVAYIPFNLGSFDPAVDYYNFFSRPEIVIHLAWEGLPNYKSSFHYEKNLWLHYQFLKNLISHGAQDITVSGTCFEYGMKEGQLDESMPTEPANAYALAKDCLNKFLIELQKNQQFVLKWIRLFYLFGEGQYKGSVLSQLEMALRNKDKVFNMSPGMQVRDYLPVEMAAYYISRIATQRKVTGSINCCSNHPITIRELVEEYLKVHNDKIELNLGYYKYPDYEPMAFWGDNKKLQSIINEQ